MKRLTLLLLFFSWVLAAQPARAQRRFLVQSSQGLAVLQNICAAEGCTVVRPLDGNRNRVFLVTAPDYFDAAFFLHSLQSHNEIVNVEHDQIVRLHQSAQPTAPSALRDSAPVSYFGGTVWHGYVTQNASQIIRLGEARSTFKVAGTGTVAIIDTGVDPTHPALKNVLVGGYDFTRDIEGASELTDLNQSTMAVVDGAFPLRVNQSTMAVVDEPQFRALGDPKLADFGHGTMVAGVVHLVAPTAKIMPIKAFQSDGTAYLSSVLHAVYYAAHNHADVINMSFDFPKYSSQMLHAVSYARDRGMVCVASVGNDGKETMVYPASYAGMVIGVASTTDDDQRSAFSNYGRDLVWVAAPGEGIVTTYPFGTYAAGWGTSFSAPFVSGAAALFKQVLGQCDDVQAAEAVSHAKWISPDLGYGRLDLVQAVWALAKGGVCAAPGAQQRNQFEHDD